MAEHWDRVLRVLVISAGFCALAVAQNSGGGPTQLDDIARQAEAARDSGHSEEAIALIRSGLAVDSGWADGWWHLGLLSYEQGRYAQAEEALGHFIKIKPRSGAGYGLLGLSCYQTGEFDKALDDLDRAQTLGVGPDAVLSRSVRYHLALTMIRKSQFGSALMTLVSFADDHDDSEDVLLALGLAMLRVPVPPEELIPAKKDVVLRSGRAAFLAAEHQYPEAEREYRALLAAYPRTPNVHYEYGMYLYSSTFYDQAIAEFKLELQLSPGNPLANISLAITYLKLDRFSEALSCAKEAVALDPTTYAAQYALGQSLVKTGDFQGAIEHLEMAAKLDPSNADPHYALLLAYGRVGRRTDAEREQGIFQQLKISEAAERKRKRVFFEHQPDSAGSGSVN